MLQINVEKFSNVLRRVTDFKLLIPEEVQAKRIIMLLHGRGDDNTAWLYYTNIAQYNKENIIIMPSGQTSFYLNENNGEQFCDYLIELIDYVQNFFEVESSEVLCIGNSMGGFGSLNLIANYPTRINRVALLSPAINVNSYVLEYNDNYDYETVLFEKLKKINPKRIYHYCGINDHLYDQNYEFSTIFGTNLIVDEFAHVWETWDLQIKKYLKQLELNTEN